MRLRDVAFWTALLAVCFALGYLAGQIDAQRSQKTARVNFVDREPPSCLYWATADRRAMCEWEKIK